MSSAGLMAIKKDITLLYSNVCSHAVFVVYSSNNLCFIFSRCGFRRETKAHHIVIMDRLLGRSLVVLNLQRWTFPCHIFELQPPFFKSFIQGVSFPPVSAPRGEKAVN